MKICDIFTHTQTIYGGSITKHDLEETLHSYEKQAWTLKSTAVKLHLVRQTKKHEVVNRDLQRSCPVGNENLLLQRQGIHLPSVLTAGYLKSFVHMPKLVQE